MPGLVGKLLNVKYFKIYGGFEHVFSDFKEGIPFLGHYDLSARFSFTLLILRGFCETTIIL